MYKIIEADKSHISRLKSIWKVCFGDSDEYIDFFFENRFDSCHCVAAICDDKICGCAYLLPVCTYEHGKIKKGFYGYAIGVLPEYRGRGIYALIDKQIENYITENNLFYILCPANEKLCDYYKSLGFTENAFVTQKFLPFSGENVSATEDILNADDCLKLRNLFFDRAIYWDNTAIEYVLKENLFTGGENLKISVDKKTFYLIIRRNEKITVTESNITKDCRQIINDFLCARYSVNEICWVLPYSKEDSPQLYGLSKNLSEKGYYMNFILD